MTSAHSNVLLVEDNPGDARLIQEMLADGDGDSFRLWRADRLSAGLDMLSSGDIGVVLLDLSLPDSLGIETFCTMFADVYKRQVDFQPPEYSPCPQSCGFEFIRPPRVDSQASRWPEVHGRMNSTPQQRAAIGARPGFRATAEASRSNAPPGVAARLTAGQQGCGNPTQHRVEVTAPSDQT